VPLAVSFMTVTALRFLPVMLDEVATVRRARALRGYRFRALGPRGGLLRSLWLELAVLVPILAAALRRSRNLATSVASRGFNPNGQRTFYPELRLRQGEQVVVVLLIVACLIVATIKAAYWLSAGKFVDWPALTSLNAFAKAWL
jgi:energy-coupling factor transport system permease protein